MRCLPALLTVSTTQLVESSERPAASQPVLPSSDATYPSSETDIFRTSEAMRCFLSGIDDTSCLSRWLICRLQTTAELIAYRINRRAAGFTKLESLGERVDRAVGLLLRLAEAWKQKLLDRGPRRRRSRSLFGARETALARSKRQSARRAFGPLPRPLGAGRRTRCGRTRPVHALARATRDARDWIPIVPRPRGVSLG